MPVGNAIASVSFSRVRRNVVLVSSRGVSVALIANYASSIPMSARQRGLGSKCLI